MYSTTVKVFGLAARSSRTAATMKMVEVTPDSTFTRTGVPSFSLNTPNQGKKAPS